MIQPVETPTPDPQLNPAQAETQDSPHTERLVDPKPTDLELPDLIPARMLNEFTYCPRLGYLEWVQGEFADNLDTLEGTFGHRRVDKPSRKPVAAPDAKDNMTDSETRASPPATPAPISDTIHSRSLMLSAPTEGLIAKLDLLEIDGTEATPVDYKRGKAPDIPEGAWEPERVQLCAQGLILRENGFGCTSGVLYFIGSKKRVAIEFDDELVARTRQLIVELRQTAAANKLPPPLIDSPKCPRCSLVGICLPDETRVLAQLDEELAEARTGQQATDPGNDQRKSCPPRVRKLLPARDDTLPMYVKEHGAVIGKSGDRLTVKKRGELLGQRRLMDVSQLCLYGNSMVSATALRELTTRGIPICHFSYGGWFHGITSGLSHKNVELRIRQFAVAADPSEALEFARAFVVGKMRNARTLLRRHLDSSHKPLLAELDEYRKRAERIDNEASLLGLEGMAAKTYFSGFFKLLGGNPDFDVNGRNRRPPRDPVNAVLSFVYSLLVKELTITLQAVGFDAMRGFFHRPRYGRPSLALDLAEEYRPLIGDSVVLTAFNNGELTSDRFLERAGAVTLTDSGRNAVISAFERRMDSEVTHPVFGYRISYRRILEVQARLLSRAVLGELTHYTPFCTR